MLSTHPFLHHQTEKQNDPCPSIIQIRESVCKLLDNQNQSYLKENSFLLDQSLQELHRQLEKKHQENRLPFSSEVYEKRIKELENNLEKQQIIFHSLELTQVIKNLLATIGEEIHEAFLFRLFDEDIRDGLLELNHAPIEEEEKMEFRDGTLMDLAHIFECMDHRSIPIDEEWIKKLKTTRDLNISTIKSINFDIENLKRMFACFENVEKLKLYPDFMENQVEILKLLFPHLKQVKELQLPLTMFNVFSRNNLDDGILEVFANTFQNIDTLEIYNGDPNDITKENIQTVFEHFSKIHALTMKFTPEGTKSEQIIRAFPNLGYFHLNMSQSSRIENETWGTMKCLHQNLKYLKIETVGGLSPWSHPKLMVEYLKTKPHLRFLSINGDFLDSIDEKMIEETFENIPHLRHLEIESLDLSLAIPTQRKALAKFLGNLKTLKIHYLNIYKHRENLADFLTSLPNLIQLEIESGNDLTPHNAILYGESFESLFACMKHLEHIHLICFHFHLFQKETVKKILGQLTHLKTLGVNKDSLEFLKKNFPKQNHLFIPGW